MPALKRSIYTYQYSYIRFHLQTALTPLAKPPPPLTVIPTLINLESIPLFSSLQCITGPQFSISVARKGQGVKGSSTITSILLYYQSFGTVVGSFVAWLSVYIFSTRLYWNHNCVLQCLLWVSSSVQRSCGPTEMKKNGTLFELFDYWGRKCSFTRFLLYCSSSSSRCHTHGIGDIKGGQDGS